MQYKNKLMECALNLFRFHYQKLSEKCVRRDEVLQRPYAGHFIMPFNAPSACGGVAA